MTLAVSTIFACGIMLFIEQNKILIFTIPAMIAAFFVAVLYIYTIFIKNRQFLLSSFYQFYFMIGLLISAATISNGAEMIEVGAHGSANGSFWVVLAFFIVGMESARLGFQSNMLSSFRERIPTQSWESIRIIILVVTSLSIAIGIYILITTGSPVTVGVDRVTFWRNIAPDYLSFYPSLILQSYFFVCFYLIVSAKKKLNLLPQISILTVYIIITIVILGEKFSAFILLASAWLMITAGAFPNFKLKLSQVFVVSAFSVAIVVLISLSYIASGLNPAFIFSRISLQAQLMWSILEDPYGFRLMPSSDWACFFGCGWIGDGREFMAYRYLPYGLYNFYYDNGTTLSGFMPAMPIATFGVAIAFVVHVAVCFSMGILQREISFAVAKENFITSFLLYKIYLGVVLAWFGAIMTALAGSLVAGLLLIVYFALFGHGPKKAGLAVIEGS